MLAAVDPRHALAFFRAEGRAAFIVLFAVFLVTTGAEAMYADIGHFGRRPIRQVWFFFVLLSTALLAVNTLMEPQYFMEPRQLYPLWPQ